MSVVYFLDDCLSRTNIFKEKIPDALTFEKADLIIKALSEEKRHIDYLFLDHDLGGESNVDPQRADTGAEVVRFLAKNKINIGRVIVHSHSQTGSFLMFDELKKAGYKTDKILFLTLDREFLSRKISLEDFLDAWV